ncbi:hypothetical protein MRX96_030630 [Rhipicephalus microplus]
MASRAQDKSTLTHGSDDRSAASKREGREKVPADSRCGGHVSGTGSTTEQHTSGESYRLDLAPPDDSLDALGARED